MYRGYRIVCVTPAGRRPYLEILARYLGDQPLVDEWQLWKNTGVADDIACIHEIERTHDRVRVVEPFLYMQPRTESICQFFRQCIDPGTIYVRFDDDICWVEDGFFEDFLDFRIEHPEYFLVYPFILNNAFCTYMLQAWEHVTINDQLGFGTGCMDPWGWKDGEIAEKLHRTFLSFVERGDLGLVRVPTRRFAGNRVSINCISWFGWRFAEFGGVVPSVEEEFLSATKPLQLDALNCVYTGKAVAHFAFHPQRPHLETTDLLARYERLSLERARRGPAGSGSPLPRGGAVPAPAR